MPLTGEIPIPFIAHPFNRKTAFRCIAVPMIVGGLLLAGSAGAPQTTPTEATRTVAAQSFEVDDTHSMTLFRVKHMGAGQFWGRLNDVSGTVQFAPGHSLVMNVIVQTSSVDTNNKKLDGHLKSPDFFNAAEFPTMTFVSASAKFTGDGKCDVTGDMTMHGVTKSITVPVECSTISSMGGATRAGFEAVFTIKRSDFGINYGVDKGMIGDETRLIVSLECVDRSTTPKSEK
ncbi:MAG: YceI family protein [Phycisphaerales bacterium]|nr:YceI family protein [Phycisphaerales bacterium]